MTNEPNSIACNLSDADRQDRLAWIAEMNAAALRGYRRRGKHVELTYDRSAVERVREFVRRERQCCPFLEFSIEAHEDIVMLKIEAPEDVADSSDALFAPYTTSGHTT